MRVIIGKENITEYLEIGSKNYYTQDDKKGK